MGKFESTITTLQPSKTPPCWTSAARPMSNSARRAIATTAAAWLARTSRMTIGFTAVLCREREGHLGRRAGQRHDHLENGFEAG